MKKESKRTHYKSGQQRDFLPTSVGDDFQSQSICSNLDALVDENKKGQFVLIQVGPKPGQN
jgi:hypothetical protein